MISRRLTLPALLLALALALPAAALAQEPTPGSEAPLSQDPPDTLPSDPDPTPEPDAPDTETGDEAEEPAPELPATGGEAVLVALLGVGMVAAGTGLRLRLDAHDELG